MIVTQRAHAKVNLALAVGPHLGPDDPNPGMHPIASWMHAIDLADTLTVEPANEGIHLSIDWADDAPRPTPIDWPTDKDLCVRAARALSQATSTPVNAHISLQKRIPVGTGLGGGSADAAATLLAINERFQFNLSLETLRQISTALGSDIAFFLDDRNPPRPALVTGLGDKIDRLDTSPQHTPDPGASLQPGTELILCIPPFSCATGAVYSTFDALNRAPLRLEEIHALAHDRTCEGLFNDLAPAADRVAPDLPTLRASISETLGTPVHVTGSGSAMFAFAPAHQIDRLNRTFSHVAFIEAHLI
jgi:4-diphosphocytidyl-2-C-methyl-D-erythritol kinase